MLDPSALVARGGNALQSSIVKIPRAVVTRAPRGARRGLRCASALRLNSPTPRGSLRAVPVRLRSRTRDRVHSASAVRAVARPPAVVVVSSVLPRQACEKMEEKGSFDRAPERRQAHFVCGVFWRKSCLSMTPSGVATGLGLLRSPTAIQRPCLGVSTPHRALRPSRHTALPRDVTLSHGLVVALSSRRSSSCFVRGFGLWGFALLAWRRVRSCGRARRGRPPTNRLASICELGHLGFCSS